MRAVPRLFFPAVLAAAGTLFLFVSCADSCSSPSGGVAESRGRSIAVMSYNVLSLFDPVDDGVEYEEFSVAKGTWDETRYRRRLDNLAKVVLEGAREELSGGVPDLVCLLEVEKPRVLEDLRSGPLKSAGYRYAAMAPAPGAAVNIGLLSRLPIVALHSHTVSGPPAAHAERNMLEATLDIDGSELALLICHWKSKLEGAEETEDERRQEAALVESRVRALLASDPGAAILICGDFNENPDEYLRVGKRYATALMPAAESAAPDAGRLLVGSELPGVGADSAGAAEAGVEPVLYSPWIESDGFSYAYKGMRERIDGFLLSAGLLGGGGLSYRGFSVVDAPFLLDSSGIPRKWSNFSGSGYSDHLPIMIGIDVAPRSGE
ncbi:MAG: endonuclease/exonuclease/phosphatase family protein [Rectinemataceae bacterium]